MHPNDGRVVSNFFVQALLGRDIAVFGDGLQTRSFCYVDDLIDGFIRLMNTPHDVIGPINLGNPYFAACILGNRTNRLPFPHRPSAVFQRLTTYSNGRLERPSQKD